MLCTCRRGNNAANHVIWDFDASTSTMVRPTKSTEDGTSSAQKDAGTSNPWTNDQDVVTPMESNHTVLFNEYGGGEGVGQGEERSVSPQLGIDETAMVLDSGNRTSFIEGAEKRNSVIRIGDGGMDELDSGEQNAQDKDKVSQI